jgi:hypothetical protein
MHYHARHRRPLSRGRIRVLAVALTVASTTLAAPLATPASPAHASLSALAQASPWLKAADIAINPPGPLPGQSVAPAVERGYVITGDQLAKYDITGTAAAQQELAAFAARAKRNYGVTLNLPLYRVYATPPIIRAGEADLVKQLLAIVLELQYLIPEVPSTQEAIDTAKALLEQLAGLVKSVRLQYDHDDFLGTEIDSLTNIDWIIAAAEGALDRVPDPGTIDPGTIDPQPYIDQVQPFIDQVTALVNNIGPTLDALARSLGIPSSDEIAEDPAHAAPVGTDPVTDVTDGTLGDVFVLPFGVGVDEIGAAYEDGTLMVETAVQDGPAAGPVAAVVDAANALSGSALALVPPGEPQWDPAGGACLHRKSNNTAWYDPCSFWYDLKKDGDKSHMTWAHNQYGTAKSKGIWRMTHFEVRAERAANSPEQWWRDWSPRADVDHGNCSTGTVGVAVAGVTLEHSSDQCDKWNIDKYEDGGHFANTWEGNTWRSERDIDAMKATVTINNNAPRNAQRYDYYAY